MKRIIKIIVLSITIFSIVMSCMLSASASGYGFNSYTPNNMKDNIMSLKSATYWNINRGGSLVTSQDGTISSWSLFFNNQHSTTPGQGLASIDDITNVRFNNELENPPYLKKAYSNSGDGNYIYAGFNYKFKSFNTLRPNGKDRVYTNYDMYIDGQYDKDMKTPVIANVYAMRCYEFKYDNFVLNADKASEYQCGFYGFYDSDARPGSEFVLYDTERGANEIIVEYDIYKKHDALDEITSEYSVYYEKVRSVQEVQIWNGNADTLYLSIFRGISDRDYGTNSYNDDRECIIANLNIKMFISGQTNNSSGTTYMYTIYIAQPRNYPNPINNANNTVIEELNSNWSDLPANVTVEEIDFNNVSIIDWLITQINSFLQLEIFLGVSIGAILWFVIGIGLLFFVLKMFLGG